MLCNNSIQKLDLPYMFNAEKNEGYLDRIIEDAQLKIHENLLNTFIEGYRLGNALHEVFESCERQRENPIQHIQYKYNYYDLKTLLMLKELFSKVDLDQHSYISHMGLDLALDILPLLDEESENINTWLDANEITNGIDINLLTESNSRDKLYEIHKLKNSIKTTIEDESWRKSDSNHYIFDDRNGGADLFSYDLENLTLQNDQYSIESYLNSKISKEALSEQIHLVNEICEYFSYNAENTFTIELQGNAREIRISLYEPFLIIIIQQDLTVHMTMATNDFQDEDFGDELELDKHIKRIKNFIRFQDYTWGWFRFYLNEFSNDLPEYYSKFFTTKKHPVSSVFFNGYRFDENAHLYSRLKYVRP